jgi:Protein of unknown function (DUF3987)
MKPSPGPDQFDWAAHTEAVAADIFGEPNAEMSRPPNDVRFCNHGSVSVNYTTGQWYDFENERGGGIKELIRVYKEIDDRDVAIAYAEECQQKFENGGKNGNPKADQPYQREVEATYSYHDACGQVAFEVVRFVFKQVGGDYVTDGRGKRTKTFRQRRPSGEPDESWLWGLDVGEFMRPAPGRNWISFNATKFNQYPATRQRKFFNTAAPVIPYQLPDLLKAVAAAQTICIAEGEKKVDLIRSFGFPATCCAGGANKWKHEHSAYLKGADVVLLPDNDPVGREHITAIAENLLFWGVRQIRILELPNLPEKGDVVDWHAASGSAEEFARLVAAAPVYVPDEAAGPEPLMRPLPPPEPFPLEALFDLASAAQAIRDIVQSPIEMCASAVLSSASLAVSAHVNIRLPTGQIRPVSCWFWCIAESGERKTATDNEAFAPQKQHEKTIHAKRKEAMEDYVTRKAVWETQSKAIDKHHKEPGAAGAEAHRKEREQLGAEPEEPLSALIMASDFTFEGLVQCLNFGQPLYGIIGSEGGQFIGGHGMTDEAKLRTITGLSAAWDGEPIKRVRAKETVVLYGRRVGMHLMVQPEVATTALADELLAKQGFMSRILACAPESLIGTRMHKDAPPEAALVLRQYKDRVLNIMEAPYPLAPDTRNELKPRDVPFSAEATTLFWGFADEVEKQMARGGEYESVRPFAAKLPEHAARLGATLTAYRDIKFTELSREDFQRGMQIAVYYATEAKRISGANTVSSELLPAQKLHPAQKLLEWLQHSWPKPIISAREIYTHGPNSIRNRDHAIDLAEVLVEHGWLIAVKTGRRDKKVWRIVRRPDE